MSPRPPALWRALLRTAVPRDMRRTVLRDLAEVFERRRAQDGDAAAGRWYRREALSFARQFARERALDRLRAARFSTIDIKLALRMIVRFPGLTIVGGMAIATAIAITTVAFEVVHDFSNPWLPLPNADRIASVQLWDTGANRPEMQLTYDLARWRSARSVEAVGAYQTIERNLIAASSDGELVRVAEMSASGFRVAGVGASLGRTLVDDDEQPGAAPVIVIGHEMWRTRFNGDRDVIGRTLRLGSESRVIVGVMPEGFAFPVSHNMWIPLSAAATSAERFSGPAVRAFAKLTPGTTQTAAQSELAAISAREPLPLLNNVRRAGVGPRVIPYVSGLIDASLLRRASLLQGLLVMVLIVCCANVAALVFARTAARQAEITVRTALGASRIRILMQFFVEALALSVFGALAGLFSANAAIQWTMKLIWSTGVTKPFWWNDSIAPVTYVYAGILTIVAAIICGVIPALKGTRTRVAEGLQVNANRGSSLSFGGGWTGTIVLQVALCVVLLPFALLQAWDAARSLAGGVNFAASEYLAVSLDVDGAAGGHDDVHRAAIFSDLAARVAQAPEVSGVAFAATFPGMGEGRGAIEVDGDVKRHAELPRAAVAVVAPGFFRGLDVPVVRGREFDHADLNSSRSMTIVNQLFVQRVLNGRNPLGRRVRFMSRDRIQPWMEIVGVVPDLGMNPLHPDDGAGMYLLAAPGTNGVNAMAVHIKRDAGAFAPRLRAIALQVNPSLRLKTPMTLDAIGRADQLGFRFFALALFATAAIGVVLATAGIYAMVSFTVSRRTREIAIRAALGANPRRIVGAIFSRAMLQIGSGALAGAAVVILARPASAREIWLPLALSLFMLVVGLFACAAPALRALRIQPSDALKDT